MIPDGDLANHHLDQATEHLKQARACVSYDHEADKYIGAAQLAVAAAKEELT